MLMIILLINKSYKVIVILFMVRFVIEKDNLFQLKHLKEEA
ncbi:hypothetical protein YN1HA_20120 [Sulfurisphaera ohwakuensis]